jgi:hypothetical protein
MRIFMKGSHEKPLPAFYAGAAASILRDNPLGLSSPKNLVKDIQTLMSRTTHEGLSFLTKTLPNLGKAILSKLESGTFPSQSLHFATDCDGNPLFMGAYLKVIFGVDTPGDKQALALKHVLQVCFLCYKLEVEYAPETSAAVIAGFVKTEQELSELRLEETSLIRIARSLLADLFLGFDPKDISPRHGPGAVASGEVLWQKWDFKTQYNAIHQVYPYYEYFQPRSTESMVGLKQVYQSRERQESGCAKVVLVQKDSRGPRLISMEPLEYQYIQQGLGRQISSLVEHHALTKGRVSFSDQSINSASALASSLSKARATLDLKDASDRVSCELVSLLFPEDLTRHLMAVRTTATQLPDGSILPLRKYAPMGSALCFPILSLCVWSISVAAIMLSGETREHSRKALSIYGDDLIVETGKARLCIVALESCGLKVNTAKSYIDSFFRESCGMDALNGVQVTPIRLKKLFPQCRSTEAVSYVSYVEAANNLMAAGYQHARMFLIEAIEKLFGPIPHGVKDCAAPSLLEKSLLSAIGVSRRKRVRLRWNTATCQMEAYCWCLRTPERTHHLEGWQGVLRGLVQPSEKPTKWMIPRTAMLVRGWRSLGQ